MSAESNRSAVVTRERSAEQQAVDVLGADDPTRTFLERIGERTYCIEEVTAYNFLALVDLIGEEATALGAAGLLNMETFRSFDTLSKEGGDFTDLIRKIHKLILTAPGFFGRALALMLSAEQEDDADYILRHIKLITQLPRVLRLWMRVNPWKDLADNFFQIGEEFRGEIKEVMAQHSANPDTPSQ